MSERATFDELLEFANKVREAGGGNPLDALMPAVPEDPSQCLIAKNLNFNCQVDGGPGAWANVIEGEATSGDWYMSTDKDVRDRIAEALNLPKVTWKDPSIVYYAVQLPDAIAQIAADFDNYADAVTWDIDEEGYEVAFIREDSDDVQHLRDFWPYIEASAKEAFANATFVNEKGELVL